MTEFCVIGGGIAGLSIAWQLSASSSVLVLERESQLGTQTTGRSAALYSELPVTGSVLALSRLSRAFFVSPPAEFTAAPLHASLGCIVTARARELGRLEVLAAAHQDAQWLDPDALRARVPILRVHPDAIVAGLLEPGAFRIDVAALVEAYRRGAKVRGTEIRVGHEVNRLHREGGRWSIGTAVGERFQADVIVNAGGAWSDAVAALADVAPLGLEPLRRTIIVFDAPQGVDCRGWPAVGALDDSYYFLPDGSRLMGSAADEVPSPPCDAQPDEFGVALAAQRIEDATSLTIEHIRNRWAGLRTFAPDRLPVAGYDPLVENFFWFAGLGGFGIQTAPALSKAAATLALERRLPIACARAGIDEHTLAPARLVRPS